MAELLIPIDIEGELAGVFSRAWPDRACFAPPVRPDLAPPALMIRCDGGVRANLVSDSFNVTVFAWGATLAEAMSYASEAAGLLTALPETDLGSGGVHYRRIDVTSLPLSSPDASHPTIPRAQITATVYVRPQSRTLDID